MKKQQWSAVVPTALGGLWTRHKDHAEKLCAKVGEIRGAVLHFSKELEESEPNGELRCGMTCGMLARLETLYIQLQEELAALYSVEESCIQIRYQLMQWECDNARAEAEHSVDVADLEAFTASRGELMHFESDYADFRQIIDGFAQRAVPRFLEELYRLSDLEHNGAGFRRDSVLWLCGELCHAAEDRRFSKP